MFLGETTRARFAAKNSERAIDNKKKKRLQVGYARLKTDKLVLGDSKTQS